MPAKHVRRVLSLAVLVTVSTFAPGLARGEEVIVGEGDVDSFRATAVDHAERTLAKLEPFLSNHWRAKNKGFRPIILPLPTKYAKEYVSPFSSGFDSPVLRAVERHDGASPRGFDDMIRGYLLKTQRYDLRIADEDLKRLVAAEASVIDSEYWMRWLDPKKSIDVKSVPMPYYLLVPEVEFRTTTQRSDSSGDPVEYSLDYSLKLTLLDMETRTLVGQEAVHWSARIRGCYKATVNTSKFNAGGRSYLKVEVSVMGKRVSGVQFKARVHMTDHLDHSEQRLIQLRPQPGGDAYAGEVDFDTSGNQDINWMTLAAGLAVCHVDVWYEDAQGRQIGEKKSLHVTP